MSEIKETETTEEVTEDTETTSTITKKTIELTDGTEFELESYENIDGGMKFNIKNLAFAEIEKVFTSANLEKVNVYNDTGECVAVLSNMALGNSITLRTDTNTIELSLVSKSLEGQIQDMQKLIEELQNQINELSANVAGLNSEEKAVEE